VKLLEPERDVLYPNPLETFPSTGQRSRPGGALP